MNPKISKDTMQMTRYAIRPARLLATVATAMLLGACQQQSGEPVGTVAPPEQAATPVAVVQAPVELKVSAVKFGRYVEPKTFVVGGVGTKFKQSDRLFAVVQLEGTAPNASVAVRLLDSTGTVVAEQVRMVEPKTAMKVNFALSNAATAPIVAGTYKAETALNEQTVMTTDLIVE